MDGLMGDSLNLRGHNMMGPLLTSSKYLSLNKNFVAQIGLVFMFLVLVWWNIFIVRQQSADFVTICDNFKLLLIISKN